MSPDVSPIWKESVSECQVVWLFHGYHSFAFPISHSCCPSFIPAFVHYASLPTWPFKYPAIINSSAYSWPSFMPLFSSWPQTCGTYADIMLYFISEVTNFCPINLWDLCSTGITLSRYLPLRQIPSPFLCSQHLSSRFLAFCGVSTSLPCLLSAMNLYILDWYNFSSFSCQSLDIWCGYSGLTVLSLLSSQYVGGDGGRGHGGRGRWW